MIITLININKIIKTHNTPFWNPLETFSSWIRSIRAKVEKQLPHINTLWVFSLRLNLRTLQRPTRASSLTQKEFILPVLHSAAWRTTTSQHVYYIVSLFHVQIPPRPFGIMPVYIWNEGKWFAENDNECIFLLWTYKTLQMWLLPITECFCDFGLVPYRCLFSSKSCTQFLLTKNTSNVSRAFVFNSALDVHTWATRDRSIL